VHLPQARGPVSATVLATLRGHGDTASISAAGTGSGDIVHDEDAQVALWVCYELSYRGFDDVDADWEWEPSLIRLRRSLETRLLTGLRHRTPTNSATPGRVPAALAELVAADDGPSLAGYLQRKATLEQFREFLAHRSVYHLKEADPHSWAIPRLSGRAKVALLEVQTDEYGGGRPERMHSELFRTTMRAVGLDDSYGHYVDHVPAITLAVSNTMSCFGLNRRWLGALIGHLAAFEMTSSLPNRRYGNGLRRLGGDADATRFFDEHIAADAVHEQIAAHDLCGTYAQDHPAEVADILFGASCALALETEFAHHLLGRWQHGTSLLRALPPTTTLALAVS
jgi:hypothetical protein